MGSNDGWEDLPAKPAPTANAGPSDGWEDVPSGRAPSSDGPSFKDKALGILLGIGPESQYAKDDARAKAIDAAKTPEQRDAEYAQYKSELPAGLASAGLMLAAAPETALGRIAMNTLGNGAVGALRPAQNAQERGQNALKSAGVGLGASVLGEGISAGAGKLADYLQQKAVGMRKYFPGVGNELVSQNVVGTKNMMAGQVERKLPEAESRLMAEAENTPGTVTAGELAKPIYKQAEKFQIPSTGEVPANVVKDYDKVMQTGDNIAGINTPLTAKDLVAMKRQGDYLGYAASGNPATSLEADLGRAQADAARGQLKDMSEGKLNQILKEEQALVLANKALQKPETIHQGMGSTAFFGKVPGQSVLASLLAQISQRGAKPVGDALASKEAQQVLLGQLTAPEQKK